MERNREAKRGSLAAVNDIGLSRRLHRITALRDSPGEEGQMETVRSRERERERVHKLDKVGDRDQELMSQRKRRRMGRCLERSKQRAVECVSDEDSSGSSGEQNYEEDYEQPSFSMSNHALWRTRTPIRNVRSISGSRIADEMIGSAFPRRARSATVKRLNERWNSSLWGFGERQTGRRLSQSPLSGNIDISPSSLSVSLRRKMKPLGPKGLNSKVSRKSLPSVVDDVEVEVIEALFDLMKQSQCSKKDERIRDNVSTENLYLISNDDFHTKSVHSSTVSEKIGRRAPDLPPEINSTSVSWPEGELKTESELKFGKMSSDALEPTEEASLEKGKDSREPASESVGEDQVVVAKEESTSFEKSNGDGSLDSTMSKAANLASEVVVPLPKRVTSFEIDLMAPPPVPTSPDQDCSKIREPDLKLNLEKPEQESISGCSYNNSQQGGPKEPNHCMVSDSKRQNYGHSDSLPSSSGWPGTFPSPGYIAPLKTLPLVDESSRTTASLIAPFTLSHRRSKRCLTHLYIACNIRQHQQLSKNCVLPPATGHATLHEAKLISGNPATSTSTSTSNSFLGNPMQRDLPGRHALATPPVLSAKGKISEVANADAAERKQLVPQQTSEKAPAVNLLQPALIFPLSQHQAENVAAQQPGLSKSVAVIGKAALSRNLAGVPVIGSLSLPAGAAAMSFNCANLSASDAPPFMTILQSNNVHPYTTSTNSGMPLSVRGGQTPVFPFLNAPYYPSMFCTPQNQQRQSTFQAQSKPLNQVQQAFSTTGACSGSKSFYKESKNQQQTVTQICTHDSFGSEGLQVEQSQKHVLESHSSSKSVDSLGSHAQKVSNGQNHGFQFQTMNFALVSHRGGNQQQPGPEHSVAVIPSQAGFSFDLNASAKLGFKFSSLPQEAAVVQMISDGQLGYQFVPSAQVAQLKIFQAAEKKNVVKSTNINNEKKPLSAKSVDHSLNFSELDTTNLSASAGKKVALDGSAQNQSSLPPPTSGNQSFSSSSTATTDVFSVPASKSQQEQQQKEMIQLQKQRTQQMQLTSTAQIQAPIPNNFHYSFNGCNNPNNNPLFSLVHNNYVSSSQWKNMPVPTTTQVSSLATTSSPKNLPQQQSSNSPGQPHVSFGSSLSSALLFQGQQFIINGQPTSSIVDGHLEVTT